MSAARVDTAHSGTPLPKKLGMVTAKGGIGEVAVLGEPEGFRSLLGDLPAEITMQKHLRPTAKLALCFIHSRAELALMLDLLKEQLAPSTHVWLIHPKAHHKPDFNQNHLRDAALAIGLVDYKVLRERRLVRPQVRLAQVESPTSLRSHSPSS